MRNHKIWVTLILWDTLIKLNHVKSIIYLISIYVFVPLKWSDFTLNPPFSNPFHGQFPFLKSPGTAAYSHQELRRIMLELRPGLGWLQCESNSSPRDAKKHLWIPAVASAWEFLIIWSGNTKIPNLWIPLDPFLPYHWKLRRTHLKLAHQAREMMLLGCASLEWYVVTMLLFTQL